MPNTPNSLGPAGKDRNDLEASRAMRTGLRSVMSRPQNLEFPMQRRVPAILTLGALTLAPSACNSGSAEPTLDLTDVGNARFGTVNEAQLRAMAESRSTAPSAWQMGWATPPGAMHADSRPATAPTTWRPARTPVARVPWDKGAWRPPAPDV